MIIAFFAGSPYTKAISDGILQLQEKGVLTKLYNKWWKEERLETPCLVSKARQKGVCACASVRVSVCVLSNCSTHYIKLIIP